MKPTDKNYYAYLEEVKQVWKDCQTIIDFCISNASQVITLIDGSLIEFEKQRIETEFCFGYSTCGQGPSAEYADTKARYAEDNIESYFKEENLGSIDRQIEALRDNDTEIYIIPHLKSNKIKSWTYANKNHLNEISNARSCSGVLDPFSTIDKVLILSALIEERDKFAKRLDAWWKRYGKDKIRIRTYWMDD